MAQKPDTRFLVRVSYEHAPAGTRQTAPGSELSLGGVFIETAAALPVGSLLSLEIESGSTKVALDARILSRRAAEGPGRPAGLAVTFIDLPNDAASSLHSILATHAPRKGTMLGLGEEEDDIPKYQSERRLPAAGSPANAEPPPTPPPARPPTPVMETLPAELPSPQVARPAPAPLSHPPAPAPTPSWAPAPTPSWAPAPSPALIAPKREGSGIVIALVMVLLVVLAAAAVLIGRTLM
jgi:hypothetical protein